MRIFYPRKYSEVKIGLHVEKTAFSVIKCNIKHILLLRADVYDRRIFHGDSLIIAVAVF